MKKKTLSLILCAIMAVSLLAGCGSTSNKQSTGDGDTSEEVTKQKDIETVNITYFSFGKFDDTKEIEDAVNAIAEEKIGVHANLNCLEGGQYMSQQTMLLSGSEDIDLIVTPLVADAMNAGAFADMSSLLDQYGQGIKDVLGENIEAGIYHDCLYGLPNLHEYAATPLIIYNADIADELNLDMSSVKTLEDMDSILAIVKEAYPNMSTPLYTSNSTGPLSSVYGHWDSTGQRGVNLGVLMYDGEPDKIVNLYETDDYKQMVTTLHDFSNKGYLNKDAAILNENYWDLVKTQMSFASVISQHELIGEEYTPSTGVNLELVTLGKAMKTTAYTDSFLWHIMATSEKQDAAMKFLNLLYTDADVENLICNGIEGKHYVLTEEGKCTYPEGIDAANSTYAPNIGWVMPNGWLTKEWVGGVDGYAKKLSAYNDHATVSPAFGFIFDSSNVANEVTACSNVVKQYCVSVEENGEVDVEASIKELNEALEDAGIDKIIQEKQLQYDKFLSGKQE